MSYMTSLIPSPEDAPTVGLDIAAPAVGIGMTRAYELAQTGQLIDGVPVIRVGSKYRVPTVYLRRALGLEPVPAA